MDIETSTMSTAGLSNHPLFKGAVAFWFALLLGGSLWVMPDAVHVNIAKNLGLADTTPSGARIILTIVGVLLGLSLGLVIARRVAALNKRSAAYEDDKCAPTIARLNYDGTNKESSDSEADVPRRPFNPREDIGEDGIGQRDDLVIDREAYTVAEPEAVLDDDAAVEQITEVGVDAIEAAPVAVGMEDAPNREHDGLGISADEAELTGGKPSPAELAPAADALGDLPLDALTRRLEQAIADSLRRNEMHEDETGANDPVIAFLRQEAGSTKSDRVRPAGNENDPQAVLKDALDRLSQTEKRS